MQLDRTVLDEMLAWGRDIIGFTPDHAINGLTVAQATVEGVVDKDMNFIRGIESQDRAKLGLLAFDVAWTFWMDDVFDEREEGSPAVDLDAIIRAVRQQPETPEAMGLVALRRQFEPWAYDQPDYQLWMDSLVSLVTAYQAEDLLSHNLLRMSYSEYLETGIVSTAVPHIATTACLIYGYDLTTRRKEIIVQRLIRNLGLSCRLHNDLESANKERLEGCLANAVIVMERHMASERSRAFVQEELDSCNRNLDADIRTLGDQDPLAQFAKGLRAATYLLYDVPRDRYTGTLESSPR